MDWKERELRDWLAGEGELTEEEQKIAKGFGGKHKEMYARQAISLHRRTQSLKALSGEGALSDVEKDTISGLGGKNKDSVSRQVVGLKRKTRLLKYLGGDKDEDLSQK